ncbi:MAG: hypothetical protein V3T20_10200, partial [Gemmatimonadota bacterium]
LLRRPTHAFSFFVGQDIGSRAKVTGVLRYVGDRDDRDFAGYPAAPIVLPSYVTIDLSGEVTVWRSADSRPKLDITARITNLLDQEYQEVFGFLTAGRTIVVGVRASI